jgi:CelD/BcsL family acetyltransferase involved in cellulose biosynthesis
MEYLVRPESFSDLEPEWWELLGKCRSDSLFLTPAWQRAWADGVAVGEGYQPLAVRREGRLVGVAPVRRVGSEVRFVADPDLCDYLDVLALKGQEEGVWGALLDYLAQQPWRTLDLTGVPEGSPTLQALASHAGPRDLHVQMERRDVSPWTELPGSWDDYLGTLSKKDRHELRRKGRRLAQAGEFQHTVVEAPGAALDEALNELFRLMRMSRGEKALFLTEEREGFFRRMAQTMAEHGYLRLFLMHLHGRPVSAVIGFFYGEDFLLYNSGYDPAYASLSVGLLLKAYCVDYSIRQGKRHFDFLRGNEPYKYDLGGTDRLIYRLLVLRGEEG